MNTTDDLRALSASVLFAVGGVVCTALLWAAVQRQTSIRIFLLKLRKYISPNLVYLCLRYRAIRQTRHNLLKKPLDNAKPPLTHDERFRDIDSSDRNGHKLGLVIGDWSELSCSNWPSMRISFPKIAGNKVGYDAKNEATNYSQNEIAETKIPLGLKLGTPSEILTP